jgi:hypothetical protein
VGNTCVAERGHVTLVEVGGDGGTDQQCAAEDRSPDDDRIVVDEFHDVSPLLSQLLFLVLHHLTEVDVEGLCCEQEEESGDSGSEDDFCEHVDLEPLLWTGKCPGRAQVTYALSGLEDVEWDVFHKPS